MNPPPMLGAAYTTKGFVTKALYLRSQPSAELERRLGFAPGRLGRGWWLLFLEDMPTAGDFEFRGYTQMSGGIQMGHLNPGGLNAEQRLRQDGYDVSRLKAMRIADTLRIAGPERLAKVIPNDPDGGPGPVPIPYPPGSGVPQWELVRPMIFRVVSMIGPGQMYLGNYT